MDTKKQESRTETIDTQEQDETQTAIQAEEQDQAIAAEQEAAEEKDTLEKELEYLRAEAEAARDRMLRAAAEFENYKKRAEREKQEFLKYATESFVQDLLPVLDNLERAIASADEEASNASIREGVGLIHQQLMSVLEKRHVQRIEALGKPFDPVYHEAMAQIPSDKPENTVVEVLQHGYMLHDRVIRPARVIVSRGPTPSEEKANSEE